MNKIWTFTDGYDNRTIFNVQDTGSGYLTNWKVQQKNCSVEPSTQIQKMTFTFGQSSNWVNLTSSEKDGLVQSKPKAVFDLSSAVNCSGGIRKKREAKVDTIQQEAIVHVKLRRTKITIREILN
jgi:hypothetical protein